MNPGSLGIATYQPIPSSTRVLLLSEAKGELRYRSSNKNTIQMQQPAVKKKKFGEMGKNPLEGIDGGGRLCIVFGIEPNRDRD